MASRSGVELVVAVLCIPLLAAAEERDQLPAVVAGAPAVTSKSDFSLFNPTPRNLMRQFTTDRPDMTESPITVDAGHVQVEISLVDYARVTDGGARSHSRGFLATNLKLGLLDNVDVQLVFTPYARTSTKAGAEKDRVKGFGDDTEVRLKINLWGNDGLDPRFGDTAFGLIPFIKFPSGPNRLNHGHVEGGLILPLALSLPGGFSLGVMAEFDLSYDSDRHSYGVDFVHSATLGHALVGRLSGYVEYAGISPRSGRYQPIASSGLSYALSDDCSVDLGATLRLSRDAHDITVFTGFSLRF